MKCTIVFRYLPAISGDEPAPLDEAEVDVSSYGYESSSLPIPSVGEQVSYYPGRPPRPVKVARRVLSREFHYESGPSCRITMLVTDP
jgi:hypothetical protein